MVETEIEFRCVLKIGGSHVMILPQDIVEASGISKGDRLPIFMDDTGIHILINGNAGASSSSR